MTPEAILQAVALESGIDMRSLLDQARHAHLVRPRQLAMVLLREQAGLSWPATGRAVQRDPRVAMRGARTARRRLLSDTEYHALYERTLARLTTP